MAGRILGKAALGLYNVGWTLASVPVDKVATLVGQVTPAFFSAVQTDRAAIRRYLLGITEGIALITFPISLGLALVARDFVLAVLGAKWEPAIAPLRLLAAAVVMPISFYVGGQRWGTVGLAIAWVLVDPLLAIPLYHRVFSKIEL